MYKIIGADQKEYGPITADQLRQWISEGRINGDTKVLPEGSTIWKRAADVPEFAPLLAPVPPSVAPATPIAPIPPPSVASYTAPAPVSMPPVKSKTNQLAVWALVSGIVSMIPCCGVLGLFGILPIILGGVALSQIKANPGQQGSGFAISGIVLGCIALLLVVIGIVVSVSSPDFWVNIQKSLNQ